MKPKAKVIIGVDIAMTILFLVQMGYHMLDNRVHEWTGIALFVLYFAASYIAILALWAAISHYGQMAVKALSRKTSTTTAKEMTS